MGPLQSGISVPSLFLCKRCLTQRQAVLTQWSALVETQKRDVTHQQFEKREKKKLKENEAVYVGEQATKTKMVYAWGHALSGALGIAVYLRPNLRFAGKNNRLIEKMNRPARVRFFDEQRLKPLDIACGNGFSLIYAKYRDKKVVLGTGMNTASQIGYHESPKGSGRVLDQLIEPGRIRLPADKPDDLDVVSLACGRAHSVIVARGEGVFTLGNNASGQCGRSVVEGEVYSKNQTINRLRDLPDGIVKVVCGQDHTMFLTETGQLWSCGLGADGQTGLGHYKITDTPQLVRGDIEGERIVSVGSSADCSLAVSDKGELFGWGNSEYNQLGSITHQTQVNVPRRLPTDHCGRVIKAVSAGSQCALLNDKGQVYVWGYGILGKGPSLEMTPHPSPIPPPIFGRTELSPEKKVVDIEAGLTYFVAMTDAGDLYSWGRNNEGCLGLGASKNQYFPWRISMPAEAIKFSCGPDHVMTICKQFT